MATWTRRIRVGIGAVLAAGVLLARPETAATRMGTLTDAHIEALRTLIGRPATHAPATNADAAR